MNRRNVFKTLAATVAAIAVNPGTLLSGDKLPSLGVHDSKSPNGFKRRNYLILHDNKSQIQCFLYDRVKDEFRLYGAGVETDVARAVYWAMEEDAAIITPLWPFGHHSTQIWFNDSGYENIAMSANELSTYLDPDVYGEHFGIKENGLEYEDETVEWARPKFTRLILEHGYEGSGKFIGTYWPLLDGKIKGWDTVMTTMVILKEVVKSHNVDG